MSSHLRSRPQLNLADREPLQCVKPIICVCLTLYALYAIYALAVVGGVPLNRGKPFSCTKARASSKPLRSIKRVSALAPASLSHLPNTHTHTHTHTQPQLIHTPAPYQFSPLPSPRNGARLQLREQGAVPGATVVVRAARLPAHLAAHTRARRRRRVSRATSARAARLVASHRAVLPRKWRGHRAVLLDVPSSHA